jgi:hypothetical protein
MTAIQTAPVAVRDSWDVADATQNPARGQTFVFNNGDFLTIGDKRKVTGHYVVIDQLEGWQFLKKGCHAEWIMRRPGEPRPPMPACPEETWPVSSYTDAPECPWKYTYFLRMLNVDDGTTMTFATSTAGGRVAVQELGDQVRSMRGLGADNAGALPIVELDGREMPTRRFGKRPRPWFRIAGWKLPNAPIANVFNDEVAL